MNITAEYNYSSTTGIRIINYDDTFSQVHRLLMDEPSDETHYFPHLLSYEQIANGGFILYFFGMFYMFWGIYLVHKNYLKPCIYSIIEKRLLKKSEGKDDMDEIEDEGIIEATLSAMATAAPEFFICLFSTFLGVTDVGLSALLGSTAFSTLITKGYFYWLAGNRGKIDWYSASRDIITFAVVLASIALLLLNGKIVFWNALIMFFIYFIYTLVMKFNKPLEHYLKMKAELKERFKIPKRLEDEDIVKRHFNRNMRRYSSGQLGEEILDFEAEEEIVSVLHFGIKAQQKVKQFQSIEEGKYGEWVKAVNIITKAIAARILRQKIQRTVDYQAKFRPTFSREESENMNPDNASSPSAEDKEYPASNYKMRKPQNLHVETDNPPMEDRMKSNNRMSKFAGQPPDSPGEEYPMEEEEVKKTGFCYYIYRIFSFPIIALLYITIPEPYKKYKRNMTPLAVILSIGWIGFFSFFITWWMVTLTEAWGLRYFLLPNFIVPLGLLLREMDSFKEFKRKRDTLNPDEFLSIPELYSSGIFQFTIAGCINWLIYSIVVGEIVLKMAAVYIQLLLLFAVVVSKLICIKILDFTSSKKAFIWQILTYLIYETAGILVDYQNEL